MPNDTMHRMSVPPCQRKGCSGFGQLLRIGALRSAPIGDLDRYAYP